MTLRERFADWISGGQLMAYERLTQHSNTICAQQRNKLVALERTLKATDGIVDQQARRILALESALTLIADQETEKANATVKRMVRIANEARIGSTVPVDCAQQELSFEETHGHRKGMAA